jgi:hypothetical protein
MPHVSIKLHWGADAVSNALITRPNDDCAGWDLRANVYLVIDPQRIERACYLQSDVDVILIRQHAGRVHDKQLAASDVQRDT